LEGGRKPEYSPKKLEVASLVKEICGSFEHLAPELKDTSYDARIEEAKKS